MKRFKKTIPFLLLISAFVVYPQITKALSDQCAPAVQCDAGMDYFAGSCQPAVNSVDVDCPAPPMGEFSAFSCDYGCYFRTRPDFEACAGGVLVNGECKTSLYIVEDSNQAKVWDGVTLQAIGVGESGLWETDGVNVFRTTGNVGIGLNDPVNYPLEVAGPINVNSDINGDAIYSNQRQMLWYNKDFNFAVWGADAFDNVIGTTLGVAALPPDGVRFYSEIDDSISDPVQNYAGYFYNKNTGTTDTHGVFNYAETSNSTSYGATNYGWSLGADDAYGTYSYAMVNDAGNVNMARAVYASAMNNYGNCIFNVGCSEAYGVYAEASGPLSTGVYGEGDNIGGKFVAKAGSSSSIGLKVYNEASGAKGATFGCAGNCTSAIFYDGNDSAAAVSDSGILIVGSPSSNHVSMDNNEIMAKSNASSASTLYLNADGGSVALFQGNPTYKLQLSNNSSAASGRGLAYAWDTYSDGRVKLNQKPSHYGLETVMALSPKTYDHYSGVVRDGKAVLGDDYQPTLGFIAQEVYPLVPEAVHRPADEANELWTLDMNKLVPVLVKAIQEQQMTIEELQTALCQLDPQSPICE